MGTRETEQIPSLPGEIVEGILSRLRVKSLLRLRCVSKSWCSLIGSKRFIDTHLQNSRKHPAFIHHRIILETYDRPSLKHCSLASLINEPVTRTYAFDGPVNNLFYSSVRVLGCSDGLICFLTFSNKLFLWNPSTRMLKQLPYLLDIWGYYRTERYGFGYDECNGDYKVFMVFRLYLGLRVPTLETVGRVYSLKTDSWKIITDKDFGTSEEEGKFASGKLHWLGGSDCHSGWEIVSFDLESEEYGMLQLPSDLKGDFVLSLGEFDGCLCMLCNYPDSRVDVWVLKQYGVMESWNKVLTIPHNGGLSFSSPFGMGPNREILLSRKMPLIIYRPKDNRLWCPGMAGLVAHVYVESLVLFVPDSERQRPVQVSSVGERLLLPSSS